MPFDIADEIHVQPLAQFEASSVKFVAFGIFRAMLRMPTRGFLYPSHFA